MRIFCFYDRHSIPKTNLQKTLCIMLYSITKTNLHIVNSFAYAQDEMDEALTFVLDRHPDSLVWTRSFQSLTAEWAVHNALYRLHILRSHTADVDLNAPCRLEWAYQLLAPLARLIIK